jgi:hypothetical protein
MDQHTGSSAEGLIEAKGPIEEKGSGVSDAKENKAAAQPPAPPLLTLPPAPPPDDPFDFDRLRLPQDFAETNVKKALTTVPVCKPDRQAFVRVHPDPAWRFETGLVTLKEEKETYLVDGSMWSALAGVVVPTILFTGITRAGGVFLWPVKHPGADSGRPNEYNRSQYAAAQLAMKSWLRMSANQSSGMYDVFVAEGHIPEPDWPDVGFSGLLKIAFSSRIIRTPDHPVIQRLHGK